MIARQPRLTYTNATSGKSFFRTLLESFQPQNYPQFRVQLNFLVQKHYRYARYLCFTMDNLALIDADIAAHEEMHAYSEKRYLQ